MGKRPTQASLALEEISVDKPAPPITVVRDYLTVSQQNLLLQESDTYPCLLYTSPSPRDS